MNRYKDIGTENKNMWHFITTTVWVIVGALGWLRKGQINVLIRILAVSADMKYKIALYRTAQVLRKSSMWLKNHCDLNQCDLKIIVT